MSNLVPASDSPNASACQPARECDANPLFHLGYRRWLDGLRGVAILLVVAFHLRLLPSGNLGVDIFFVLSGFLITSLLVEEWQRNGSLNFKQFYLRRILRLLPAFVVLLLAFSIHTLCCVSPSEWNDRWCELAAAACYTANFSHLHGVTFAELGHTWSLSVEEQFYLLWPALLCLMLWKLPRRQMMLLVAVGILAAALWRLGLHHEHRWFGLDRVERMRLYVGLDTRADSLLAGCLASLLVHYNWLATSARFLKGLTIAALLGAGVIAFCVLRRDILSAQNYDGLFTLVALATAVIILRLLMAPAGFATMVLESAPLVGAGRISYGWYLFHIPVIDWIAWDGLGWRHPGSTALAAVLSLASALLSYYLIEEPFLRLKDRLHSSTKAVSANVSTAKTELPRLAA